MGEAIPLTTQLVWSPLLDTVDQKWPMTQHHTLTLCIVVSSPSSPRHSGSKMANDTASHCYWHHTLTLCIVIISFDTAESHTDHTTHTNIVYCR